MSDHYTLTTEDNSIIWKNQLSRPSLNYSNVTEESLNNESYVTAVDDENETQYLSVLETNSDVTLEELHDITLSNGKLSVDSAHLDIPSDNVEEVQGESQDQQVVVFSIDGSDDLYGIQFAQDEDGNIQKYQFKFRTTEDGQLEPMPETIQLLPNDSEVQEESNDNVTDDQENNIQVGQQLCEEVEGESHLFLHEENLIENVGFMRNQNVEIIEENSEELIANDNEKPVDVNLQPEDVNLQAEESSITTDQMKMNPNYMVFVKGEPEQVIEEEFLEDEFDNNRIIKEEITHSQQNNTDLVKSELFEEESNDLLDNALHDNTELIDENEEEQNTEEKVVQEENLEEQQLEGESYPGLQVENEVTVLEYQQCLPEDSVPLQETDEALSNGSFESLFLEKNPENENESEDTETYETVEGIHVTADEELTEERFEIAQPIFQQPTRKSYVTEPLNIVNQRPKSFNKGATKKNKTTLYYFIQKQEKENVNSVPLNAICKSPMKTHPRSILRRDVELRVIDDERAVKSERNKAVKTTIRGDRLNLEKRQQEVTDKRFARSKKAVEERLFNNFISKTTIPHAPVRQTRLPRKQEIKPVDNRRNEEIIVQEVMVSSKGFVEDAEERLKNKDKFEVTSIVELSDSEDEAAVKTVKKRPQKSNKRSSSASSNNSDASVIEIIHSDEESKPESSNESTKRGRGRPKKNSELPGENKRSRSVPGIVLQSPIDKEDSSPSKKSRADSSEADSDSGKKEIVCPLCPKSFPSQNSLNTHIQHHNLENSLRNNSKVKTSEAPVIEYHHTCEICKVTFKNRILLKRHECKNKQNLLKCNICSKSFKDIVMLNFHKKSHIKQNLIRNTATTTVSPKKILPKLSTTKFKSPRKFLSTYKCKVCPKVCTTLVMLAAHEKTHKKFNCSSCNSSFSSRLQLDTHVRVSCVKTASPKDRRISFKIRRSFVHSPRRTSMSRRSVMPTSSSAGMKKSDSTNSQKTQRKSTMPVSASKKAPSLSWRRSFIPGLTTSSSKNLASASTSTKSFMSKSSNGNLSTGNNDVNKSLHNSTMNRFLDVKVQCDSCPSKFNNLTALFKHKVKAHGLNTPDKNEKPLLHKPKVTYGGIPANDRLRKVFSDYRAQLQECCQKERL